MQSPASPSSVPESAIDAWSSGGRKPQFGCSDRKIKAPAAQGHVQRRHKGSRSSRCLIAAVRNHQIKEVFIFPPLKILQVSESPDSRTQSGTPSLRQGPPEDTHSIVLGPILFIQSPSVHYIFKSLQSPVFSSPPWMPATLDTSIPFSICWDLSFQGFLFKNKLVENIGFPSKPAGSTQDSRRPSCTNADICRHFHRLNL